MKLKVVVCCILVSAVLSAATSYASLTKTEISQLYVSIFNRASEGEGNIYWSSQPDMSTAATAMLDTGAARDYFGSSLDTHQAFIEHIYLNTLNKTIADDPDGIAYWVGLLNAGTSRGDAVATLVGVIKDYAPGGPYYNPGDAVTVAAYNQFVNRVTVCNYMADTVQKPPDGWETLTQLGSAGLNVGQEETSVALAINYINTYFRQGFSTIIPGESEVLATREINSAGDMIVIDNPGDPLHGLEVIVPPDAYEGTRQFRVSSAPIISHTFGELFEPLTPLISVENGGDYSEEFMVVTIPVQIPVGYVAAPFFFDADKGKLEPMQLVSTEDNSITVITRHFSDFLVTGMAQSVLDGYLAQGIRSGFSPGVDDFSFTNRGSYIAPSGHCAGQSIGAMWYHTEKPEGNQPLWGSYDNNFSDQPTPALWEDDSYAYRFCSVLQKDINWDSFARNFWLEAQGRVWHLVNNQWELKDVPAIGPEGTRNLFALSMLLTGEPQYVAIYSNAGGGHAMIVWSVTQDALHIADPNYPGRDDRLIYFGNGAFDPYSSGDNYEDIQAGQGKNYETILYMAKSTLMPEENIARRWQEVQSGSIGNDLFPGYQIKYLDQETSHYEVLGENQIFDKTKVKFIASGNGGITIGAFIYRDGVQLPFDGEWQIDLIPGDNLLGFYVLAKVGENWEYVDFQYINVIHEPEETDPNSHTFVSENGNIEIVYQMNGAILGSPIDGSSATSVSESRKHDGQSTGSGILHISGHIKFTAYQLRNESYHDRLDDHTISVWVRDPGFLREDRENFSFPADQSVNHPFSVSIPMMDSGWYPGANYSISVRRGAADLHSSHGEGPFEYLRVTGAIMGYQP